MNQVMKPKTVIPKNPQDRIEEEPPERDGDYRSPP